MENPTERINMVISYYFLDTKFIFSIESPHIVIAIRSVYAEVSSIHLLNKCLPSGFYMSVVVAVKVNNEPYCNIGQSREIILSLFSDIFLSFPK